MKTFILAASSGIALLAATPALASDVPQDAAVETVEIEMSEERRALALAAVDAYWPRGQGQHMATYLTTDFADFLLYTPVSELAEDFGIKEVIGAFAANMDEFQALMAEMAPPEEEEEVVAEAEELQNEIPTQEELEAMVDTMVMMFGDQTLAGVLETQDEHFEERIAIMRDIFQTELTPIFDAMEPKLRDTYAEMFAKRFTDEELADIAAFAQTAGGQKYARDQWLFTFDPTYYKAVFLALPEAMTILPGVAMKIEERMSVLPPIGGEEEAETEGDVDVNAEASTDGEIPELSYEMTAEEMIWEAEELEALAADFLAQAASLREEAAALEAQEAEESQAE